MNQIILKDRIKRGAILENEITNLIKENIDIYAKTIKNVYIYSKDKKRTEIDIILITAYGIFVIESKNCNGIICGKETDTNWIINYYNNGYQLTNNFIAQNEYHIKFLSEHLNKDITDFKSFIVLGKHAKNNIVYDKNKTTIININELIEYLIDNMHNSETIYSHEVIDKIYIDLKYYCEHSNIEYSEQFN